LDAIYSSPQGASCRPLELNGIGDRQFVQAGIQTAHRVLDFVIALFEGVFTNRVIHREYGQALPWNFPVTLLYWCPHQGLNHSAQGKRSINEIGVDNAEDPREEAVGEDLHRQTALGESIESRKSSEGVRRGSGG
jgi:hypothetical protein